MYDTMIASNDSPKRVQRIKQEPECPMRTSTILSAARYNPCDDLGIVTCFFNPVGYQTKLHNYKIFAERIEGSGLELLTVECAFKDNNFSLAPSAKTIQLKSNCVLWQRERLLNVAISCLSEKITKVAWLDCDVLFSNPDWAIQTSQLLDKVPILQPYEQLHRLPKGHISFSGEGETHKSFGYVWNTKPDPKFQRYFREHGHTGLAWAARRSLMQKHGLYDACLSGNGDYLMAHAMCGDFDSPGMERYLGNYISNPSVVESFWGSCARFVKHNILKNKLPFTSLTGKSSLSVHFKNWGIPFYKDVKGRIAWIPGSLLHLWHGDPTNRKYFQRDEELRKCNFNPAIDLQVDTNGTWKWRSDNFELHQWAEQYFAQRKEDGENDIVNEK